MIRSLKLDYDGRRPPKLRDVVHLLERAGKRLTAWGEWRTRHGWHVVALVAPMPRTLMEVVALQAILGSDPWRESCNVFRVLRVRNVSNYWRRRVNVLYDPQWERRTK